MATQTDPKVAVEAAFRAALQAEGYLLPDGKVDNTKLRQLIFEMLRDRKVRNISDRSEKAVTRGSLVEALFPALPGPEDFEEQYNPQLAQAAYQKVNSYLWNECRTAASAPLQRLVALGMGNGYVLVRTKIGKDSIDAVYITDDVGLLERDLIAPENAALERAIDRALKTREMLISRKPLDGERWARGLDRKLKSQATAVHEQLRLALEASKDSADIEDETETDGEE